MTMTGTILQNLRDFTVQIRQKDTNEIVGTGIAVSMDGKVLTSAHVVKKALGVDHRNAGANAELIVYFPQALGDERKAQRARVASYFPHSNDDVALLQLIEGSPPLGPEQLPVLGNAEDSEGNGFRSFGFRPLAKYMAAHSHGRILGSVKAPDKFLSDPIQLESPQLGQGMSGSAVLDVERNLVVGLVSNDSIVEFSRLDKNLAFAVNARVAGLPPFNLPIQTSSIPKLVAPQPTPSDFGEIKRISPDLGDQFFGAPSAHLDPTGWFEILELLKSDWISSEVLVTSLVTTQKEDGRELVRFWLDSLKENNKSLHSNGVFWWNFYDKPNVSEFFLATLEFIGGGLIDIQKIPSSDVQAQIAAAMLANGKYIFVLDGLELVQHETGDEYGLLKDTALRNFLRLFGAPGHNSFCLIISSVPILDLLAYTTYSQRSLPRIGKLLGATSDQVADEDQLGFKDYIAAFADLIESPYTHPPLTIGIYGEWGMGKSFLLTHIGKELERRNKIREHASRRKLNKIFRLPKKFFILFRRKYQEEESLDPLPIPLVYIVNFNAWEYSASEAVWPGLVRKVMDTMERNLVLYFPSLFLTKLKLNFRRLWRQWRSNLVLVVSILSALVFLAWWQFGQDWRLAYGVLLALGVSGIFKIVIDTLSAPLSQWIASIFKEGNYGAHIGYMAEIRADLEYLEKVLRSRGGRILVTIDDLDRCEPNKAVETLLAIKQLLDFKSFIICLGIDYRIIAAAVEQHYDKLLGIAESSGQQYLEKIIQIPFRIPEPSSDDIKNFISKQLGEPKPLFSKMVAPPHKKSENSKKNLSNQPVNPVFQGKIQETNNIDPLQAQEISQSPNRNRTGIVDRQILKAFTFDELKAFHIFSRFSRPNPRHLKRLVNTYRLVRSLAEYRAEYAILRNPAATVRWLLMCSQWPYTTQAMLHYLERMLSRSEPENFDEFPARDPINYLLDEVKPYLSIEKQRVMDSNIDILQKLAKRPEGRVSWKELNILKRYTVNFYQTIDFEWRTLGSQGPNELAETQNEEG